MDLVISNNNLPLYQQIYNQISSQIIRGELESNTPLPPIRTIAKELRISVIPVKRAWEELERNGFIVTAIGRGSFVASLSDNDINTKRHSMIYEKLSNDIEYYKSLGITYDEIIKIIKKHY